MGLEPADSDVSASRPNLRTSLSSRLVLYLSFHSLSRCLALRSLTAKRPRHKLATVRQSDCLSPNPLPSPSTTPEQWWPGSPTVTSPTDPSSITLDIGAVGVAFRFQELSREHRTRSLPCTRRRAHRRPASTTVDHAILQCLAAPAEAARPWRLSLPSSRSVNLPRSQLNARGRLPGDRCSSRGCS